MQGELAEEWLGAQATVLGPRDEGAHHVAAIVGPKVTARPGQAGTLQILPQQAGDKVGMGAQPGGDRIVHDLAGGAVVHDGEIVGQAHQAGALAHNVMGQAMERAHAVADLRREPARFEVRGDAAGKVAYGRVDQGDDQHLLVIVHTIGDQVRRQGGEGVSFATAGDCGHAHVAAAIVRHLLLCCAGPKHVAPPGRHASGRGR